MISSSSVPDIGGLGSPIGLRRDELRIKHHRALAYCLRMISAQTLRVCREGKPLHTFPDHALALALGDETRRGAQHVALGAEDRERGIAAREQVAHAPLGAL